MSGTPLLSKIETALEVIIQEMSIATGYNYNWGPYSTNEPDLAKGTLPRANIYLENDESTDSENGPANDMYGHKSTYRIDLYVDMNYESDNPRFEINDRLNKAFDDLLMLFGNNYNISGTADTIQYKYSKREYLKQNDIMLPSKLMTYWVVEWESSRRVPTNWA